MTIQEADAGLESLGLLHWFDNWGAVIYWHHKHKQAFSWKNRANEWMFAEGRDRAWFDALPVATDFQINERTGRPGLRACQASATSILVSDTPRDTLRESGTRGTIVRQSATGRSEMSTEPVNWTTDAIDED